MHPSIHRIFAFNSFTKKLLRLFATSFLLILFFLIFFILSSILIGCYPTLQSNQLKKTSPKTTTAVTNQSFAQTHTASILKKILQNKELKTSIHSDSRFANLVIKNRSYIDAMKLAESTRLTLHLFIEGDGNAWMNNKISRDPTPSNPIMLSLMLLSSQPSIYLGRPCYYRQAVGTSEKNCHPGYWTNLRYSPEIVENLKEFLSTEVTGSFKNINIIGHSGGGTLALLLADAILHSNNQSSKHDLEQQIFVITLSGNIDISAWTSLHKYTPLSGSINPIGISNLARIRQLHFLAEMDTNIPPKLVLPSLKKYSLNYEIIKGIDHTCCWHSKWPLIENKILSFTHQHLKKP